MKKRIIEAEPEFSIDDIDEIVRRMGTKPDCVVNILQSIQAKYRYLPKEALKRVCEISEITPMQITGVSTFYSQFRHHPVGKYTIKLCFGTACYVRGAELIADAIHKCLKIEEGADTDPDRIFTVEKVACLGCCSLAPCMMIGDVTYGHLTPMNVARDLESFLQEYD